MKGREAEHAIPLFRFKLFLVPFIKRFVNIYISLSYGSDLVHNFAREDPQLSVEPMHHCPTGTPADSRIVISIQSRMRSFSKACSKLACLMLPWGGVAQPQQSFASMRSIPGIMASAQYYAWSDIPKCYLVFGDSGFLMISVTRLLVTANTSFARHRKFVDENPPNRVFHFGLIQNSELVTNPKTQIEFSLIIASYFTVRKAFFMFVLAR